MQGGKRSHIERIDNDTTYDVYMLVLPIPGYVSELSAGH